MGLDDRGGDGVSAMRALFAAASGGALLAAFPVSAADRDVSAIHRNAIVIDAHADVPLDLGIGKHDAAVDSDSKVDLPKLERGQVDAVALAVFVNQGARTGEGYARAREEANVKLAAIQAIPRKYPGRAVLARSANDIGRAARTGKRAIIISMLNAYPLGTDLAGIDEFYAAGVRCFGLVHQGNNDFADSSRPIGLPLTEWGGLSPLGKQAVGRLNQLGMIIDISQLTPAGVMQTLALSKAPVIASHSGVKGVLDIMRNLSDAELDALKANDGVIQIVAFGPYLMQPGADLFPRIAALRAKYGLSPTFSATPGADDRLTEAQKTDYAYRDSEKLGVQRTAYLHEIRDMIPVPRVSDLVNSIDYAVKRIGIDHVGISSDFNHSGGVVGWNNEGEAQGVTAELVRRGYSEADIDKIWGGNYLRVFRAVEAVSRSMSAQTAVDK
jgi:membrane dipeptidase